MAQIGFMDGQAEFAYNNKIRLIELFAGIGSQAKALERLGADFEHYRVCEFDKYAVQSYNAVHGTNHSVSDITKITGGELGITNIDNYTYVMTYSFPCTDLSSAGKQRGMARGDGTRSGLLWEVERLLNETDNLPQVMLMENVPEVISPKFISDFSKWVYFLESLGYKNYYQVLNAKDYGIPQNRERCFVVSLLGDYYYEFPETIPLKLRLKDLLESEVDLKYWLTDAAVDKIISSTYVQNGRRLQKDDISDALTAYDCKGPKCIGNLAGGKWDKMHDQNKRVYDIDAISPTLCTSGGGNQEIKICEPRVLTPCRNEYGKAIRQEYESGRISESRHKMTNLKPRNDELSNALTTVLKDNYVLQPCIDAVRGRNPDNPSDRTVGAQTQQRLEINKSGLSNALTTVQKDNMVVERSGIRKINST